MICAICLDPASSPSLACCRHGFHAACLARWRERSKTCPLCRCALPGSSEPKWRLRRVATLIGAIRLIAHFLYRRAPPGAPSIAVSVVLLCLPLQLLPATLFVVAVWDLLCATADMIPFCVVVHLLHLECSIGALLLQ